ncbi:class III lanthionine synthetase LanKC [Streptomyces sp. NPDC018955]
MDPRYEKFCLTDPVFYETLDVRTVEDGEYPIHRRELPEGWRRTAIEGWWSYAPVGAKLPSQGWKIHVSAMPENAADVATMVYDYCLERGLAFKITVGPREFLMKNSKYAERAGSGKLATIYPVDDNVLRRSLEELGGKLDGRQGPYILSDLRWQEGPLYVRYGAFLYRPFVDGTGAVRPGIEDPDGNLVPDPRGPVFTTPEWVTLPGFLQPELERRSRLTVDTFPYKITRAVHFSNGGGVYEAEDPATGKRLIIKEARLHAGLDAALQDAVTRLRAERDILRRLAGLPCVPALIDYLSLGENEYLVEEFIDGTPLNTCYAQRNPLMGGERPPDAFTDYATWCRQVGQAVEKALEGIHERGVVYGDLHPFNVLVRESAEGPRVTLVDFEVSWLEKTPRRLTLGHPGFGAPPDRTGFDADHYALAALRLALFVPLTTLIRLDPGKARQLAALITDAFGIPPTHFDADVALLGRGRSTAGTSHAHTPVGIDLDEAAWPARRDALAAAITASATPERDDRLYPGDVEQFHGHGGLGFAHGAAGVLWALRCAGVQDHVQGVGWLVRQVQRSKDMLAPGFYDGAHGIAYALWVLGRRDEAVELLEHCLDLPCERLDSSLYAGLSGIGLNLLAFAEYCGDGKYRARAERVAGIVQKRIAARTRHRPASAPPAPAGLMRGASGPALLFIRMFEATGSHEYLDAAATALRLDLERCVTDTKGALQVDDGWRVLPYLHTGSVGIAFVLRRYLEHRQDPHFTKSLRAIEKAARSRFYVFSGLFDGRAGMVLFHATAVPASPNHTAEQVRGLNWHALQWKGHTAFPGNQILRLSMDLASGNAGVLLALAAAHGVRHRDRLANLPFLT